MSAFCLDSRDNLNLVFHVSCVRRDDSCGVAPNDGPARTMARISLT